MDIKEIDLSGKISQGSAIKEAGWVWSNAQPNQLKRKVMASVDTSITYQTFEGLGGAFSELGYQALLTTEEDKQDQVMRALFSKNGLGLHFCRFPVGADDFSLDAYSLDDVPADYEMKHFSMERDEKLLLPFIKRAQAYAPDLRFHVSPWSPPAWMKTTKKMEGGGKLFDSPEIYRAYARYLVRFLAEYEKQGVKIDRLLVQNEADAESGYPTCNFPPKQMIPFVTQYLAPEMKSQQITTELWAGTFRTITGLYSHQCALNQTFCQNVSGFGFQYSLPEHITDFRTKYPGLKVMHTESPCNHGENTDAQAVNLLINFIELMKAGCDVYTYWNMILNEKAESTWGWKQNSLITISDNGEVIFRPDYAILKLIHDCIDVKAKRIAMVCINYPAVAFLNPDQSIGMLFVNNTDSPKTVVLTIDGKTSEFTMKERSIYGMRTYKGEKKDETLRNKSRN